MTGKSSRSPCSAVPPFVTPDFNAIRYIKMYCLISVRFTAHLGADREMRNSYRLKPPIPRSYILSMHSYHYIFHAPGESTAYTPRYSTTNPHPCLSFFTPYLVEYQRVSSTPTAVSRCSFDPPGHFLPLSRYILCTCHLRSRTYRLSHLMGVISGLSHSQRLLAAGSG